MKYLSVCSGIEAATVAWHPYGFEPVAFSEIEPFPIALLAHHYPTVPNWGDMTKFKEWPDAAIDVLVGGTPCQSFSVAGLRKGLDDPRGNLALVYLAIADKYRPDWVVWENVPGVLSSSGGRDFGAFLGALGQLGYGWAYRILDAQYVRVDGFGRAVPQRRRRVFVVGHSSGDWRRAAAVLFERESLSGHPAPRRQPGQGTAATVARSVAIRGRDGTPQAELGDDVANAILTPNGGRAGVGVGAVLTGKQWPAEVASTLDTQYGSKWGQNNQHINEGAPLFVAAPRDVAHSLRAGGFDASEDGTGRGTPLVAHALTRSVGATEDGTGRGTPLVPVASTAETIYGVSHADAQKTNADEALRALREAVGAEAYSEWGFGVVASFWPKEILRPTLHGRSLRRPSFDGDSVGNDTSPLAEDGAERSVRTLWQAGCDGCPPQGWQPPEWLAVELGAHLPKLPHQGAPPARLLLGLWRSSEGLGLLREALSALQEVWRPASDEGQPVQPGWAVRRLTPTEAERLQGFPAGYTAVPHRGKPAADGPRYKALGNSMAVNAMRWIGRRIALVDGLGAVAESSDPSYDPPV